MNMQSPIVKGGLLVPDLPKPIGLRLGMLLCEEFPNSVRVEGFGFCVLPDGFTACVSSEAESLKSVVK